MDTCAHFTIQAAFEIHIPRQTNRFRNGSRRKQIRPHVKVKLTTRHKEGSEIAACEPAVHFPPPDQATTNSREIRVAVVDDEEDMRLFLLDALTEAVGFTCVGCFASASEALAAVPRLRADLVLMDIGMPDVSGIECTRLLKRTNPEIKIVMVTGWHDANSVHKSIDAGADAYLTKPIVLTQLLVTLGFAAGNRSDLHSVLTARENEMMRLFAQGFLYKEIAEKLNVSYSAVHKHQHQIFIKLHASNRIEAIEQWRKLGGH